MTNNSFEAAGVDSGTGIIRYLEGRGLLVVRRYAPTTPNNIIGIPDLTTFNWKSDAEQIRVNCKEDAMHVIEANTKLKHIDNGPADPPRPYSFLLDDFSQLEEVVSALLTIEKNRAIGDQV